MKKVIVTIVVVFIVAFVAFATLDEALRFMYLLRYEALYGFQPPADINLADHPFLTVVTTPNYHAHGIWWSNSRGFRTPEFSDQKPPHTYRIVVLGGSTVTSGSDIETTFSHMLQDTLNQHATGGQRYEVIDAGCPFYSSTQEMFLLQTQVINWHPNMVIVYDGWNDAEFAGRADWQPNWNYRNVAAMQALKDLEDQWGSQLFIVRLIEDRMHPTSLAAAFRMHPESAAVYAADLRNMIAISREFGIVPVFVFQPSLLYKTTPSAHEVASLSRPDALHYYGVDINAMRTMMTIEARTMQEVAEAHDVRFADFRDVFDGNRETMYHDLVHTTDDGNRVVATHLATFLAPVLQHGDNAL